MKRRIILKYSLFQVPDLVILLLIMLGLELKGWAAISSWKGWLVIFLWLLKDALFFPFLWPSYEPSPAGNGHSLVGEEGIVEKELTPSGFVRVRGELWRAEAAAENTTIKKGEKVIIRHAFGLTLVVHRSGSNSKIDA